MTRTCPPLMGAFGCYRSLVTVPLPCTKWSIQWSYVSLDVDEDDDEEDEDEEEKQLNMGLEGIVDPELMCPDLPQEKELNKTLERYDRIRKELKRIAGTHVLQQITSLLKSRELLQLLLQCPLCPFFNQL